MKTEIIKEYRIQIGKAINTFRYMERVGKKKNYRNGIQYFLSMAGD